MKNDFLFTKERVWLRGITSTYNISEELRRLRKMPRVIKYRDQPWTEGPTFFNKNFMTPEFDMAQCLHVHVMEIAPGSNSQKHGHMNEAMFYVLEGRGYEIHDGKRYDWQAGDISIVHTGCVHQHFNADPERRARMLVIKSKAVYLLFNLLFQRTVENYPQDPIPGHEDYYPGDF